MARIAEATCATCHHIKPKTEMREVAVNRQTGSRFGLSHSRRNNRQSASVSYTRRHVWVCRGCRAPKSDGLIPWRFLFVVGLAAMGMWFASALGFLERAPALVGAAGASSSAITTKMSAAVAPVKAMMDASVADESSETPSPLALNEQDWNTPAIDAAVTKALDRGKTASWKADGYKGQAVVSEATVTDGTECRNVYVTSRRKGVTRQSPTTTHCRTGEGEWATR